MDTRPRDSDAVGRLNWVHVVSMQRDSIPDQEVAARRRYVEGEVRSVSRLRWRRGRSDVPLCQPDVRQFQLLLR
jgi:hypothetical protein